MVLLFKGIAPLSQLPATIASGAPPRPNHAVFKEEFVYVSKPFGGARGGEGVLLWGATSGRKCYRTPAFSGIPNKGDNIKAHGKTKGRKRKFSILSLGCCRLAPLGNEPMTLELQRHCFTH